MMEVPQEAYALMALVVVWGCVWVGARLGIADRAGMRAGQEREELRRHWLTEIARHPSHYILAVQTIRNSIMAASFVVSALAVLVASVAAWAPELSRIGQRLPGAASPELLPIKLSVALALSLAAMICFFTSIRRYHQLGYTFIPEAALDLDATRLRVMRSATRNYRAGMRWTFLLMIVIASVVNPWLAVVLGLAMIFVMNT